MTTSCPMCNFVVPGAFPAQCPSCSFSLSLLAVGGTTPFQRKKWKEHTDIVCGRQLQLRGKAYNASFDYSGVAKLEDVLRFTVTFGDRVEVPALRSNDHNPAIITYIPEPIGSGTSICNPGALPCSGVCLLSPHSNKWAHSFPVMDDWVQRKFPGRMSRCRICENQTGFAQPICPQCYVQHNGNWLSFL